MTLAVSIFGEFALYRDGVRQDLPASKKTRALLAYLALNPRPHRRERLCEIFWDRTDDPRAALRWSLTKLRPLVNDPNSERLSADRERIRFEKDSLTTHPGDPDDQPLAGLDLPDCEIYQAWLVAEREHLLNAKPPAKSFAPSAIVSSVSDQDIQFCRAEDGTALAYAKSGNGPPLVKAANWLTHLEFDWTSPLDARQIRRLSEQHTLLRYDGRGNGLSDWDTENLSFETMVTDLEAVVDAAGLDRFPLIGMSQGAAVAIAFAARHPQRVSHLVLHGGFASGWLITGSDALRQEREAVRALLTTQWGNDNPSFRNLISTHFIPGASDQEVSWFSDFQRKTTSAENVSRFMQAFGEIDVRDQLPRIQAPTLVMHSRGDEMVDMDTTRELVSGISGAKFISLESVNHSLLDREPASEVFIDAVLNFVAS
ncbi:MAG: alpha/beta fold hydrolase [Pseudomonadota bacterium]